MNNPIDEQKQSQLPPKSFPSNGTVNGQETFGESINDRIDSSQQVHPSPPMPPARTEHLRRSMGPVSMPPDSMAYDARFNSDQNRYSFLPQINNMQLFDSTANNSQSSLFSNADSNKFAPQSDGSGRLFDYDKHDSMILDSRSMPMLNRRQTVRYIPLTPQGNLVIDVPVAEKLLNFSSIKTREFTHTRYTAVTCGADDFAKKGYALRQQEIGRNTEIFIVVTMYNEDHLLFSKTMAALMKNIRYLCSLKSSKMWGADGWKKVVVCIVSDGRNKISRKVLDILGIMGVFQDGIMKDSVNEKPVTAHLFEYTTQICVTKDLKVFGSETGYVPMQVLFCLKEKNAKKINSHRWFFNAFGTLLRPKICVLIDVGTKPSERSLYYLWEEFDANKNAGGACGEIYADLGVGCSKLLNPIVGAQNFEYKTSNILDKPLESVFGYITVLPGAFSAYRYEALQGAPLTKYFRGETMHGGNNVFAANMFLAEDRILCFEVVTKRNAAWTLEYVKNAKAETDVPNTAAEFISQRRRWMNGSFAATLNALLHWSYIYRTNHSLLRKFFLSLQMVYNFLILMFGWFLLSSLYLGFYFIAQSDFSQGPDPFYGSKDLIFSVLKGLYVMAVMIIVICSLGNRPQGTKWVFILCMWLFAIVTVAVIYLSVFTLVTVLNAIPNDTTSILLNPVLRDLIVAGFSMIGMYFISGIAYLDPWHCVTSFVQYTLFFMCYPNILNVYAFCNLHDVSWGTKGDNVASSLGGVQVITKDGKEMVSVALPSHRKDINFNYDVFHQELDAPDDEAPPIDEKTKQEDYFRSFRTYTVLLWFFSNGIIIVALTNEAVYQLLFKKQLPISSKGGEFNPYLRFLFYFVALISAIRFIGSILYLIKSYSTQLVRNVKYSIKA